MKFDTRTIVITIGIILLIVLIAFGAGILSNKKEIAATRAVPERVAAQAKSDTAKATADADKSADAADTAASSARRAADSTRKTAESAEGSAQDASDSARDSAANVDSRSGLPQRGQK